MNIKWNEVTWYTKIVALLLFVGLPFVGFYCGVQYGKLSESVSRPAAAGFLASSTAAQSGGSGLAAYYVTPSEWQTDANNTAGGFSIAYPIDFNAQDNYSSAPSADWRMGGNGYVGVKYFTLTVPKAFEPQTNFNDATLTVGASADRTAVSQCLVQDATGGPVVATSSVAINGIQFTVFHSADAGAGNYYETTSYRTLHAGRCYAVEYTVHSSQIGNYPSSYGLRPFDTAKIASLMQNIIGTFKFL